jgi:serine/threonine-protein kinase
MPLIDGPTLSDILFARRRREADGPEAGGHPLAGCHPLAGGHPLTGLPEPDYLREVVRLLAWITRALAALHDLGAVHCDVKPGNILLDQEGRAYLCDFGLAYLLDEERPESHGQTTGTPIYMACEKLLGWLDVDEARCDVYSMGVTLYEATTLERPFHIPGDLPPSDWSAYLAVATAPRPCVVRPGLPEDLEAIILRAMERDLARRYPSAAALADDLDRFLAGEPIRVATDPTTLPVPPPDGSVRMG